MLFPLVITSIPEENRRTFMEALYLEHREIMFHTARRMLNSPQDAEDVLNEALLRLQEKTDLLQAMNHKALRSYCVVTVRNTALSLLRKRAARPELLFSQDEVVDHLGALDAPVEESLIAQAEAQELLSALSRLPLRQRDLLEMKYLLLYEDDEIASTLRVQPDSLRSLLSRAKRALYQLLKEDQA